MVSSTARGRYSISIHALREEGDNFKKRNKDGQTNFYPRPPRGGRRWCSFCGWMFPVYFYPRPPRGGRRIWCASWGLFLQFLSTPSARRATDLQ